MGNWIATQNENSFSKVLGVQAAYLYAFGL